MTLSTLSSVGLNGAFQVVGGVTEIGSPGSVTAVPEPDSEIFPGTFASTTETADYLLQQLNLTRRPVLKWGPMGLQQLSEARAGKFLLLGYAGNSAPDHVDQLHSLPVYLKWLR
ncbi:MAG: hypothetical protein NTW28_05885 [Candidatus Solibacter sp.]|nr:hypothetical protein [Candidatus Solibacter sp.]